MRYTAKFLESLGTWEHWAEGKSPPYWESLRLYVFLRDKRKCWRCHGLFAESGLECHHIVPKEQGGSDNPKNLRTLCGVCHDVAHTDDSVSLGIPQILESNGLKHAMSREEKWQPGEEIGVGIARFSKQRKPKVKPHAKQKVKPQRWTVTAMAKCFCGVWYELRRMNWNACPNHRMANGQPIPTSGKVGTTFVSG